MARDLLAARAQHLALLVNLDKLLRAGCLQDPLHDPLVRDPAWRVVAGAESMRASRRGLRPVQRASPERHKGGNAALVRDFTRLNGRALFRAAQPRRRAPKPKPAMASPTRASVPGSGTTEISLPILAMAARSKSAKPEAVTTKPPAVLTLFS